MKHFLNFLGLLCLFLRVAAQENTSITGINFPALKHGDMVPNIVIEKILNNGGNTLQLADFKGKLLILDFWATSCGACIQAMPRLDSLSDAFGGNLVVLPVTAEKAERIFAFQHSNTFLKRRLFRTVVEDKALHILFPHRMLPHEVWIDGTGKVLGFTEALDITQATVAQALAGKGITAGMKEDILDFDRDKPLLVQGNGGSDSLYKYRSVITGALKGLPSGMGFSYDSAKRMTIVRATNVSIKKLYTLAYKGLRNLTNDNVDLDNLSGLYCYELDLPSASPTLVRRSIREDLDRFFGVRSEFTGTAFRLVPLSREGDFGGEPLTL